MSDISSLIQIIFKDHFPGSPGATPRELALAEERIGATLPSDLVEFYKHCDGAKLFDEADPPYRFLRVRELQPVSRLILDKDSTAHLHWIALCDVRDGNYIALDTASSEGGRCRMLDCFHETFPDPDYIMSVADSFRQLLERALVSNGKLYWLRDRE